jgi:protein-disulfide isomerase
MWTLHNRTCAALLLFALLVTACARQAPLTKEELATALREHPEVLLEALEQQKVPLADIVERGFKERVEQARKAEIDQMLKNPLKPAVDAERPFLGNADAPVTMVEFSDFFCQYCPQGTRTAKLFHSRHPNTVRMFYKHLPLSPQSRRAAAYFEALAMQDDAAAWKFMDRIFAEQQRYHQGGDAALTGLARELGADMNRLAADIESSAVGERIENDMQEAARLGIRGTPTFILGGVPIRGAASLEEFESVLDRVVQAKGAQEKQQ